MFCNEYPINDLVTAVYEGKLEKVKELIGLCNLHSAVQGHALLRYSIKQNDPAITKLLLKSGVKVNKEVEPSNTPLHLAVIEGDIEIVEMLIARNANIHAKDYHGRTPLYNAVEKNEIQITELLLNRGAMMNVKDRYGLTPLHVAAEKGYMEISEHLLNSGAYVDAVSTSSFGKSCTPLHVAVDCGNKEIIKLLINRGANLNYVDEQGRTALHHATHHGYSEIVECLLNNDANVDIQREDGRTALHIAAANGYLLIAKNLLKHRAQFNLVCTSPVWKGFTPLLFAAMYSHEKIVKLLLEYGAMVDTQDKDGMTILHFAVERGYSVIVKHILKFNPDVNNESNRNALTAAVYGYGDNREIIESLLEYGFTVNLHDVNIDFLTVAIEKGYFKIIEYCLKHCNNVCNFPKNSFVMLSRAVQNKHADIVKLLMSYGADVNAVDYDITNIIFRAIENNDLKCTKLLLTGNEVHPILLHHAVKHECIEIADFLLQHGAEVNASDCFGRTSLHLIAGPTEFSSFTCNKNSKEKFVELLVTKGANINSVDIYGQTPLHSAIISKMEVVVEALLKHNPDVNAICKNNETPLHFAAQWGNAEIAKLLLNKGANINAKRNDGKDALYIAVQEGHNEIVELLLKFSCTKWKIWRDWKLLHTAVENDYVAIVRILLNFGVDVNVPDNNGRTALHIASDKGNKQSAIALLDYGSDINIMSYNNCCPFELARAVIKCHSCFRLVEDNSDKVSPHYSDHNKVAQILHRHVIKMEAANLYVNEKNIELSNTYYGSFQRKCKKEIDSLKNEKIMYNLSLYDVLSKNINQLARYIQDSDSIVQIFKSDYYLTDYPIYANMINNCFRRVMERKVLLEESIKLFFANFHSFSKLPLECAEEILSYLSNTDLRILIDTYDSTSISSLDTYTSVM